MAIPGQYQQYPQFPAPTVGPGGVPPTVRRAVLLMRAGAVAKLAGTMIFLFQSPGTSTSTSGGWFGALIAAGLWLWMAKANQAGNNWARVTGTVFFGIASLGLVADLFVVLAAQNNFNASNIPIPGDLYLLVGVDAVSWLLGLIVTVLIWQKQSSAFYKPPQLYPAGWGIPGAPQYGYQNPYQPVPGQQAAQPMPGQPVPGQAPLPPIQPADPWQTPQG